jgi:hypothetical protein
VPALQTAFSDVGRAIRGIKARLPRRFPDLSDDEKLLESSFVVPTECLGEVAATVRAS